MITNSGLQELVNRLSMENADLHRAIEYFMEWVYKDGEWNPPDDIRSIIEKVVNK